MSKALIYFVGRVPPSEIKVKLTQRTVWNGENVERKLHQIFSEGVSLLQTMVLPLGLESIHAQSGKHHKMYTYVCQHFLFIYNSGYHTR